MFLYGGINFTEEVTYNDLYILDTGSTHTHTHIYIYTHTHTHTHTLSGTHTLSHTQPQICTLTHTYVHIYLNIIKLQIPYCKHIHNNKFCKLIIYAITIYIANFHHRHIRMEIRGWSRSGIKVQELSQFRNHIFKSGIWPRIRWIFEKVWLSKIDNFVLD